MIGGDRQAQHRLAILRHAEEVTGNVARTCRYFGISRPTFYTWQRRCQDEGLAGRRDRSSAPHHCPNATHADINRLQVDVKFIEPIGVPTDRPAGKAPITGQLPEQRRRAKYYQFTAIDDCTRFHRHVLDEGIAHTYIKPASPHLNDKVERSHRIDAEKFYRMLAGIVIDDTGVFNDKPREGEDHHNYHRPSRRRIRTAEGGEPSAPEARQMPEAGRFSRRPGRRSW